MERPGCTSPEGSPGRTPDGDDASILGLRAVSKQYGAVAALSDVSVAFAPGAIHAVCGENGAGKSTLVKVLTGMTRPDRGTVLLGPRPIEIEGTRHAQALGIAVVAQELSLCPDLSILDNIWLGSLRVPMLHRRAAFRARAAAVMAQLGLAHLDPATPAGSLRLGERQLVEIARALVRDARVLILDEPTATLSDGEIALLFAALRALKAAGCAIVYISHRLNEVFALCDTVTVLRNGMHVRTGRTADLTRPALIELMLGRRFDDMFPDAVRSPAVAGVRIATLRVPGRVVRFDAEAEAGSILCLAGQVGSGASDVIDALAGLVFDATGDVVQGGVRNPLGSTTKAMQAGFTLVSGDRAKEGIFLNLRVDANLVATSLARFARFGVIDRFGLARFARDAARLVQVDARRLAAPARDLSGGNQQKLAFGRNIGRERCGVLLMNEPTRGIDVGARADIYRLMRDFCARGHALILTSSDLEEIVGLGDAIVTLYRGRCIGTYRRGAVTMARIVADITHPDIECPENAHLEAVQPAAAGPVSAVPLERRA